MGDLAMISFGMLPSQSSFSITWTFRNLLESHKLFLNFLFHIPKSENFVIEVYSDGQPGSNGYMDSTAQPFLQGGIYVYVKHTPTNSYVNCNWDDLYRCMSNFSMSSVPFSKFVLNRSRKSYDTWLLDVVD